MRRSWTLTWRQLALIALPFVVFLAINMIDWHWGHPSGYLAQPYGQDGHVELAARYRLFAGFLLFAGAEIAVIVYAAGAFRLLDRDSRRRLAAIYAAMVLIGGATVLWQEGHRGNRYLEQSFTCSALLHLHGPLSDPRLSGKGDSAAAPAARPSAELVEQAERAAQAKQAAAPGRAGWRPAPGLEPVCPVDEVRNANLLLLVAAFLLFLAMPALVFAAISCLAAPADGTSADRREACTVQAKRLSNLLYLSAALMVSGLLFAAARLNWPAYSLHPADAGAFADHVSGYLLYLSVGNSLLIASYYLPVAALLAASRPGGSEAEAAERDDSDPYAPLKTAATILSPVLLGLFGEAVKLLG